MRRAAAAAVACVALVASGCSVLLDWGDFTGGTGGDDGGTDAVVSGDVVTEAEGDVVVPASCTGSAQCAPAAPSGWSGPVALFTGPSGQTVPPCGAGYGATPAFDGHAGLDAPMATCSPCSCGAATGGTCSDPVLTFYVDNNCQTPSIGTQSVTGSCAITTLIGARSVTVAAPVPDGGTCAASGGVATTPPATWTTVARACTPSSPAAMSDCASGEVCAPAPSPPFSTHACVMQPGAATACPSAYPAGPQVFYAGLDDQRGCSPCACGAPAGAHCSIASPAVNSYTVPGCVMSPTSSFNAPNGCAAFQGGESVELAQGATPTLDDAGTCSVSGGGAPAGAATASGPVSFCCLQ